MLFETAFFEPTFQNERWPLNISFHHKRTFPSHRNINKKKLKVNGAKGSTLGKNCSGLEK